MISTRDFSSLPDVDALQRLMQSLAMLDAILSREWEYRYFSFNRHWSPSERMGSMRNGEGDHYFALFSSAGCWLKGFDHEASMSPFVSSTQGRRPLFEGMPAEFDTCLTEPAFVIEETTFCIWRRYIDREWRRSSIAFPAGEADPDGSASLLQYLDGHPQTYCDWASEYFERDLSLTAVRSIYLHEPLDQQLVTDLNVDVSLPELRADIEAIGYPVRDHGRTSAG